MRKQREVSAVGMRYDVSYVGSRQFGTVTLKAAPAYWRSMDLIITDSLVPCLLGMCVSDIY